jgi:hypothetical protein
LQIVSYDHIINLMRAPVACPVCCGAAQQQPGMADQANTIKVSLRAVDGFDTTAVTQAFGGGGHSAASSCLMSREAFQSWQVGQQQGGGSS